MTTQRHELEAWLGDDLAGLTTEQVDQLMLIVEAIEQMYPGADDEDERREALTAATQFLAGETTLAEAAARRASARLAVEQATAALRTVVVAAALDGRSDNSITTETGLSRETVRAWLGRTGEMARDVRGAAKDAREHPDDPDVVQNRDKLIRIARAGGRSFSDLHFVTGLELSDLRRIVGEPT
ncbi:hypothetical protein [Jiangella sp. DSM 45060]|uniref:hypothetical protein n=1 Tax=Jiangella sp. DSM 45060 TaxID=1798224 RepID=UPI000879CFB0|nr:hypothetical protein [Jiangella sp. DSM 45060]SDT37152.1 hypothetical protein SAMN04515669_3758 [Jiangella sp. DSM 45060]